MVGPLPLEPHLPELVVLRGPEQPVPRRGVQRVQPQVPLVPLQGREPLVLEQGPSRHHPWTGCYLGRLCSQGSRCPSLSGRRSVVLLQP